MNKNEILEQLHKKNRRLRLPDNIDFEITGNVLHIGMSETGLVANMQDNAAAFEGWAVCLKAWFPHIQKIIIEGKIADSKRKNEHFLRFIYRLIKFTETYDWAETDDFREDIDNFKNMSLVVNVPLKEAKKEASHKEAKLEREYYLSNCNKFDAMDHQLPVHLFNEIVDASHSITPSSFLDIWSIKKNDLSIYELKIPSNRQVGIISELMFYVNVMSDIMKKNIVIPTTTSKRSFDCLYAMCQKETCKQINGIFLSDVLHSMINAKKKEILAIINDGHFEIPITYSHQTINLNIDKKGLLEIYPQTEYKSQQERRQKELMLKKSFVFDNAEGEKFFIQTAMKWLPSHKIIQRKESIKNLFVDIRQTALDYFELNDIEWWGQSEHLYYPTGNTLSSQIQCLNHLFAIRADRDAVLKIIKKLLPDIEDILPSPIDEKFCEMEKYPYDTPSYISFEFTFNNKDLLHERCNKRGANCTSVDAFVYAKDVSGKYVLIPIEWKYTESYEKNSENKKCQKVIEERYLAIIGLTNSHLEKWEDCYCWDPYYELARQSLLMEQIIRKKPYLADDYQHIVVCPKGNKEMQKDAEKFKNTLSEYGKNHFHIIDPQEFLTPLYSLKDENCNVKYAGLLNYLEKRYWN